jgi:hypothetical protein
MATDMNWNQFEREEDALVEQLNNGEITREEYNREIRELRAAAREQKDREDIIASGRGYLLRDW